MLLHALITLVSGAVYEASCVVWVHYSERGRAIATACVSMLIALAQIIGIGESVHDWKLAPFFIFGYGAGTYVAVRVKKWIIMQDKTDG